MTRRIRKPESDQYVMTEEELKRELKGSLLILTTASPDKRDQYKRLFTSLDNVNNSAGIDAYITDSGALGIPPAKTPEKTGDYNGNLDEKARQQLARLRTAEARGDIRPKLKSAGNIFDADTVNIMGMTEDSGWEIRFDEPGQKARFIAVVKTLTAPRLRERDRWLLEKLDDTGFPGPNLKPLQEHLGGFDALMEIIYQAARDTGMQTLRYGSHLSVSFVSPRLNKLFTRAFHTQGDIISQQEYKNKLVTVARGEAINSDFVHVPHGQKPGEEQTIDRLQSRLLVTSSRDLPAAYIRRDVTEWLQNLIGKRRSARVERQRDVHIAFVSANAEGNTEPPSAQMPVIHDLRIVELPTERKLRHDTTLKPLNGADVVVLIPETSPKESPAGASDPNLRLALAFLVTVETEPEAMRVPIVLDNRTGNFNPVLDLIRDAFAHGRLMGDSPLLVAGSDAELRATLTEIKNLKQREPAVHIPARQERRTRGLPRIPRDDGIFTVFIGGGHANNTKRDLEDAHDFGYYCAKNQWRIITGAGSVEGSMGATHTGFIQYHLDQIAGKSLPEAMKTALEKYKVNGKYDAEGIILGNPALIDSLADNGFIPRHMFYGYSMKDLLAMESPSGKEPPGITCFEAGNRVRRLHGLLACGTKVFLPGSIGTDEEFEHTLQRHGEARRRKLESGAGNDVAFGDGTPDEDGAMIVYNRDGHLDALLAHYKLLGNSATARAAREIYNIRVVDSREGLMDAAAQRAANWLARVRPQGKDEPQSGVGGKIG